MQDEHAPRLRGNLGQQGGVDCRHASRKDVDSDAVFQRIGCELGKELGALLEVGGAAGLGLVTPIYSIYWHIPRALQGIRDCVPGQISLPRVVLTKVFIIYFP